MYIIIFEINISIIFVCKKWIEYSFLVMTADAITKKSAWTDPEGS